jgi:uncharacterized protein (DUF1330 family)
MNSLQVVVRLWIHPGQQSAFESYERKAVQIMRRYGGSVQQTVRTTEAAPSPTDPPFEVHVLEFPSVDAFHSYRSDAELAVLSAERAAVISRTEVILGTVGPKY